MAPEMTDEQRALVAEQDGSTRRRAKAKAAFDSANDESIADALASLRAGVPPAEVERHSPFTGSYLRRIARENGIEGDKRYDRTGKG